MTVDLGYLHQGGGILAATCVLLLLLLGRLEMEVVWKTFQFSGVSRKCCRGFFRIKIWPNGSCCTFRGTSGSCVFLNPSSVFPEECSSPAGPLLGCVTQTRGSRRRRSEPGLLEWLCGGSFFQSSLLFRVADLNAHRVNGVRTCWLCTELCLLCTARPSVSPVCVFAPLSPRTPPPQRASWRWGPLSLPFWGYIMQVPFFWGSGSHSVLRLEVVVGNSALFLEGFPTWRMLRGSWGKMNDLVKWPPDCTFTAKNMVTWHFQCLLWPSRVACRLGFHCCLHLGAPQGRWPGTGSELSTCLTYDPLTSVLFHIHRG